ncbi:MAG: hypothetical protein RIT22_1436, partial [Bacteroidota bacterium]
MKVAIIMGSISDMPVMHALLAYPKC